MSEYVVLAIQAVSALAVSASVVFAVVMETLVPVVAWSREEMAIERFNELLAQGSAD